MRKRIVFPLLLTLTALGSGQAWAAGGSGTEFINYYHILLHGLGVDQHAIHDWQAVAGGLFSLLVIVLVGLAYRRSVASSGGEVVPDGRFSIRSIVESVLEFVCNLARNIIGEHQAARFYPLLCGLFLFIFVSNLTGLVPGFLPATDSISTNLALGMVIFLVYHAAGIKEHGMSYVKQFLGPVLFLMPLMLIIELVAHLARPVSLSLRLYGNIFGDHLVLSVFTGLTYLVLPALLLFFGLLVASLQSFVFTLLSSIYISMAISHDH